MARASGYASSVPKRLVDLLVVCVAGPVVLPVALLIAGISVLTQGIPVLFRQDRIGRDARVFRLVKFRTMRDGDGEVTDLLSDEQRLTRFGAALRRTSLDELPTLWNVLVGDMSLVGPRPLLPLHVDLYRDTHPTRLAVRPGVTGLAQVRGRQAATFRQRLDADVEYVARASFLLDLEILLRTVAAVVTGRGVVHGQNLTEVDDIGLRERILREESATLRWEHGSSLQPHGPVGREGGSVAANALPGLHVVLGTARQAIATVLADRPGRARLWLPSYYCDDVIAALTPLAELRRYPDLPGAGPSTFEVEDDDVVLATSHFGLPVAVRVVGGTLIVDATHALGLPEADRDAAGRPADLALASLRKTLPVADGALVWSPGGRALPEAPLVTDHREAAEAFGAALAAKRDWLGGAGADGDKAEILAALRAAEHRMEAGGDVSRATDATAAALSAFDLTARWERRDENRAAFARRLGEHGLGSDDGLLLASGRTFAVLLAPDLRSRDLLRTGLVERRVYPAVLWPQPDAGADSPERRFSERCLMLHVDARYGPEDLRRVADIVADVWRGTPAAEQP